jgi:hypothetical protein
VSSHTTKGHIDISARSALLVEAQRPPSGELLYAVRDGPGDPEKQPKLSDETKDLILKLTNAAGPENAALFKMLVESGEARWPLGATSPRTARRAAGHSVGVSVWASALTRSLAELLRPYRCNRICPFLPRDICVPFLGQRTRRHVVGPMSSTAFAQLAREMPPEGPAEPVQAILALSATHHTTPADTSQMLPSGSLMGLAGQLQVPRRCDLFVTLDH